jgi:hypothetical protein
MNEPEPKPQKRRARWVRIGVWLVVLGLFALIAAGLGLAYVYQNRTDLTNQILRQTFRAFDAEIGELDISREGIDIKDIRMRDPKSGGQILMVKKAEWRPSWSKVSSGNLGHFVLDGARLEATAEQLRSWTEARATEEPSAAAPGGVRLPPLFLDSSELRDVVVNIQGDAKTPSLSFKLEHSVKGLDIRSLDKPGLEMTDLKITDLLVTQPNGEKLSVPELMAQARLRPEDGMIEVKNVTLRGARVRVTPSLRDWIKGLSSADETAPSEPLDLPWLKGVSILKLDIDDCEFHAERDALGAAFPAMGGFHLHYEITGLEWRPAQPLELGDHRLEVTDFSLKPQFGSGGITVPKLRVEMNDVDRTKGWVLDLCSLEKPNIEWTQALEDVFVPTGNMAAPTTNASSLPKKALFIQKLKVAAATFEVLPTRLCPVSGGLVAGLDLQHLSVGAEGVQAEDAQRLLIEKVSLSVSGPEAGETAPLVKMKSGEIVITPQNWNEHTRIDKLVIQNPEIRLTEKTAPWMKKTAPAAESSVATPPSVAAVPNPTEDVADDEVPLWQRVNFTELTVTGGVFEFATSGTGRVEGSTAFSLTTEPAPDEEKTAPLHRLTFTGARGMVPEIAKLPVAGIESFETVVRLPNLWRDRRIESLKIKGGQIEAGDALMSLFSGGQNASETAPTNVPPEAMPPTLVPPLVDEEPGAKPLSNAPRWEVGNLEIGEVAVTLQKIAPGLPPLRFEVNLQAKDTPLEMEQLAQHVVKQRVELSNLTIPSPYDPLRTVARLDTIFVDFSLDGVFAERLDKVEIVSPTLFVGEDLFWYVDYFRKYAAGEIKSAKDSPQLVSNDKSIALAAAKEISEAPPKKKGWTVDVLQVHSGKLVLAPKGVPLPGFGQPFPFSFITRLDDGRFDATLDIPPDTYTLPDLKLEFRGMKGKVEFNLPMKGVSNNLSEVFRVDQIRWRELHLEDAHMSLTYDMNGMYGQFGGAAYEGYLNGAFNIYFDQSYSWDGWIAASGLNPTEVTEKMTPAYFILNGKVDCKAVANGSSQELYQADLSFKNVTPGQFSLAGLNDMIKEYAGYGIVDLTSQITRIGLETLRDFDYDTADGEGRFYGREGKGFLRFKGPTGIRNFDINVLDHRWKDDTKKKPEEKDENTLAQP